MKEARGEAQRAKCCEDEAGFEPFKPSRHQRHSNNAAERHRSVEPGDHVSRLMKVLHNLERECRQIVARSHGRRENVEQEHRVTRGTWKGLRFSYHHHLSNERVADLEACTAGSERSER